MTWEELEKLPDEIGGQIELWEGRVVWVWRGPAEHQECSANLWNALRRCARAEMSRRPAPCWRASTGTNVFFGAIGRSDFMTPDFLVYRCLAGEYQDIRAADALVAGEVFSPASADRDIEARKARYAGAGIPWYWEVILGRSPLRVTSIRAYGLRTGHSQLPDGVAPLRRANYIVAGEWRPDSSAGIEFDHPFAIHIPWLELEF
ncbi:Uma2 family endonuclease [Nocardia huaxiensis]|uniref:Uma2 family endonuclease n=2 Tax=Nocardia huaxiensis TaxID=2755382 RepID=A0A7D6VJR6_9NOCA|nr:Uma2 family endonuclease [Nocardia huaxiensis]